MQLPLPFGRLLVGTQTVFWVTLACFVPCGYPTLNIYLFSLLLRFNSSFQVQFKSLLFCETCLSTSTSPSFAFLEASGFSPVVSIWIAWQAFYRHVLASESENPIHLLCNWVFVVLRPFLVKNPGWSLNSIFFCSILFSLYQPWLAQLPLCM